MTSGACVTRSGFPGEGESPVPGDSNPRRPLVSVIIPTWQEGATIERCLQGLVRNRGPIEVIICDGGSADGTVERAGAFPGVRIIQSARGRAAQMNRGAAVARGDILWFLHADSQPPAGAVEIIRQSLARPSVLAGAFRFAIDSPRRVYRVLEWGVRLRSEWLKAPYGDQGLFLRRSTFEALGGFPPVPLMEDLYLVRELRRLGKLRVAAVPLLTSARRWERLGVVRTTLGNWKLVVLDWLGVPADRLSRVWRAGLDSSPCLRKPTTRRRLVVFTRYPEPGKTKTRLVPALGAEGAAALQEQMTLHTLSTVNRLKEREDIDVEVRFSGASEARMWQRFGDHWVYTPQGLGDLGVRMRRAFDEAFRAGTAAVIVTGADCPGITPDLIANAFDALQSRDLVLGPASDGGYYLIGLRRPVGPLFQGICWGSAQVLQQTLQCAQRLRLSVQLLNVLDDVDRPADLWIWEQVASDLNFAKGSAKRQGTAHPATHVQTLTGDAR